MSDPRFAKKWFIYVLVLLVFPPFCLLLSSIIVDRTTGNRLIIVIALAGMAALMMLGYLLQLVYLLAHFANDGISLLTKRGRVFLQWSAITKYELTPSLLLLYTPERRYALGLTFYKNPAAIIQFVDEQIRAVQDSQDRAS